MIRVVEKVADAVQTSWRLPRALLQQIDEIAKKENVSKTQLVIGWIRYGIADYKAHGLEKVRVG